MTNIIKSIIKYIFLFIMGGSIYYCIENVWRGYSHWTMFILGGICFILIGLINNIFSWETPIEAQALIGASTVTALELITGIIVNVKLEWNIWDYSDIPFNFLGQICLPFSILWLLLSAAVIYLDDFLRYKFFNEKKPYYTSFLKDKLKGR